MLICWTTSNFLNAILQIFLYRHDLSFKILNDIGEKIKFRLSLVNKKDWILSANILILSTIYSGVISPYKTFSWYFSNLLLLINLPCHLNLIFKQSFLQKVVTSLFCLLSFGLFIDLPQHLFIFKTLSILSALYSLFIIFRGLPNLLSLKKGLKKDLLLLSGLITLPITLDYVFYNLNNFDPDTTILFCAVASLIGFVLFFTNLIISNDEEKPVVIFSYSFSAFISFLILPKISQHFLLEAGNNTIFAIIIPIAYLLIKYLLENFRKTLIFASLLFSIVTSYKIYHHFKDLNNKPGLPAFLVSKKIEKKPNIYILIYDSYQTANKMKKNYGIDNSKQERKLTDSGFKIYEDVFTSFVMSIPSTENMLGLGGIKITLMIF